MPAQSLFGAILARQKRVLLGYANGGKTHTPHIDAAVQQGIKLTAYHTYKVCAPTRASLM